MKKTLRLLFLMVFVFSLGLSAQQPQKHSSSENRGLSATKTLSKQEILSVLKNKQVLNQKQGNEMVRLKRDQNHPFVPNANSLMFTPVSSSGAKGLTDKIYVFNEMDTHYTGQLGTPNVLEALPTPYPNEIQSGEYINGVMYVADYNDASETNRFGKVDLTTGVFTQIGTTAPDAVGMAWNPVTNKTYVTIWEESGGLYEINLTTGATSLIGSSEGILTIAIDNDGVCYAVKLGNPGSFGTINLTNGAYTEIASIPFHVSYVQNMSVDRTTNELYWSAREGTATSTGLTGLYKMNKATGERTLVGTFDEDFRCESFTIIADYIANEDIPAAPTDFSAIPSTEGALGCVLTWKYPTLTVGGDPLSTLTSLVITRDESVINTIPNPSAGATGSYVDSPSVGGNHTYEIYAVNSEGEGLRASTTVFVGNDVLVASIDEPVSLPNMTATETVTVTLNSNGHYALIAIPLTLKVDGVVVADEIVTGPINPSEDFVYTFNAKVDLSAVKTYLIEVSANLTTDVNPANNLLTKFVTNYGNTVVMGGVESVTSCDIRFMDNGVAEDYIAEGDQIVTFYPATAGSMVNIAFNDLATAIDPYFGSYDALFILNGAFTFDDLELLEDEDIIVGFAGDYADELPDPISAQNVEGALTVYFMIGNYFGMVDRGWDADITCVEPPVIDVEIKNLELPVAGALTDSETITVTIVNKGAQTLNNIPLICEINGTALPTATVAGPLTSFESTTYSFTADMSTIGTYDVEIYVNLSGDENPNNDTVTGSTACTPPVLFAWDFEEGMPDDFVLRVLDEGVAHSTNIFPNNEAWAIFMGDSGLTPLGTQCAISQSWFDSGDCAANRWMITPQIKLLEESALQWDASCYEEGYPDGYSVKLSTTDNETESFTKTLFTITSENSGWTNHLVDLSEYNGQKVYIAFVQDSEDQNMIAIDNIRVLGTSEVALDEVNSKIAVELYPNPVADYIAIKGISQTTTVFIYTVYGKKILQKDVNAGERIDVNNLPAGVYLVDVNGAIFKVLKK